MGKCRGLRRFWRKSDNSGMTTSQTSQDNDEHQPSTSSASASLSLDSLQKMDFRDLCEQIFALLRIIEDEGQENVVQTLRNKERPFWQRLACLPILRELFKQEKPDLSVLKPYFIKGENEANTLAYMIFRDITCEIRIAVGLLSVGASLENWVNINQHMREVCMDVFQKMCELGKLLHDLRYPMTDNQNLKQKLQQELQKGAELLVEGSIMCAFHVNGSYLTRYLQGCPYKESFMWFLGKLESVHKALCSWSESLIFLGVRSSPLSGRPYMNYPSHAVGIEREKQDIIEMLEWKSKRIVQEKGMLLPDGRGSVRIPYPLWRYFIVTKAHQHVHSIHSREALVEEFKQRTADQIKAVVIGGNAELSPHMMPKNLQLLCIRHTGCLGKVPAETPFNKLTVYAGDSSFPLQMAPFIRFLRLYQNYFEDGNPDIPLPLGLRNLQLVTADPEIPSCTWERMARLRNLRALTLGLYMDDVKIPVEFCALAAISNTIRELYIRSLGLSELPQNFGQLRCLHILRLEVPKLRRLPEGFGMLSSLRELWFHWCWGMEELCSDFSNLGSLHTLGWIRNGRVVPEKCWKEMVKLKRLTTLVLDSDLHEQFKILPFPQRVSIYYPTVRTYVRG